MKSNDNNSISKPILCEDLLIRIRDEFVSMAMVILDKEIKKGTIKLNGSIMIPTDKNKENEEYLFMMNNLIRERKSIHEKYDIFLSSNTDNQTSQAINRKESLKKFLMTVDTIYILMNYSDIINSWIKDVLIDIGGRSIKEILKSTINNNIQRTEVLDFITNKNNFVEQKVISESESIMINDIVKQIR